MYVAWMGTAFLKFLKMIIIPLLLSSVMAGIMNVGNTSGLDRLGFKTIFYYLSTSLAAICTGLVMVNIIQPGVGADLGFNQPVDGLANAGENFGQTLMNIIPENIFYSLANGEIFSVIFFAILSVILATQLADNHRERELAQKGVNARFELMMKIANFIILFTPLGVFGIMAAVVEDNMGNEGALLSLFLRLVNIC